MNKKMYKKRATMQAVAEARVIANNPNVKSYGSLGEVAKSFSGLKSRMKQLYRCSKIHQSI
ncbi:MAG: hypothetical protein ACRC76_10010 [Proteocatella sp.]